MLSQDLISGLARMVEIADEAATIDLCTLCLPTNNIDGNWWDTDKQRFSSDDAERVGICIAHLEWRGLLQRHPNHSAWVHVAPRREDSCGGHEVLKLDWSSIIAAATRKSHELHSSEAPADLTESILSVIGQCATLPREEARVKVREVLARHDKPVPAGVLKDAAQALRRAQHLYGQSDPQAQEAVALAAALEKMAKQEPAYWLTMHGQAVYGFFDTKIAADECAGKLLAATGAVRPVYAHPIAPAESEAVAAKQQGPSADEWLAEFDSLLDAYQDAQRTGTFSERVMARTQLKLHFRSMFDHYGQASSAAQPNSGENCAPCKGLNCGCTDGRSHSLECEAQHAAAIAGGTFVPNDDAKAIRDAALEDAAKVCDAWAAKSYLSEAKSCAVRIRALKTNGGASHEE